MTKFRLPRVSRSRAPGSRAPGPLRLLHSAVVTLIALLLLLPPATAAAQAAQPDPVQAAVVQLGKVSADVRDADTLLDRPLDPPAQRALQDRLSAAQKTASDTADDLQDQITLVDARIAQLGPVTAGVAEAPDIAAQRRLLGGQRATIDSAIKRGRLLAIEAKQLGDELDAAIAAQRGRRLAVRVPSIATPGFWMPLASALPSDLSRLWTLFDAGGRTLLAGARGGRRWAALLGLLVAAVLLGPVRLRLRSVGRRYAIDNVPGHRVRRSGFALWRLAIGTAMPTLAALAFTWGLQGANMVDPRWQATLDALVPATGIAAFIAALAGALLLRGQSSWRLLPMDDGLADALRPWSWWLAALALVDPLLTHVNDAVRASGAAHVAADTAEAIVTLAVSAGALVAVGRQRRAARVAQEAAGDDADKDGVAHPTLALVLLVAATATATAALSILLGYVGFALWLMRAVVVWPAIVIGALYVLLTVVDDVATSLFAATSRPGILIGRSIGIRPSAIDQFGVLLSGILRLLLVVLGVGAILTPFGANYESFFTQLSAVSDGLTIGQVTVSPGAVLRALLVLGVGLALARGFLHWLNTRYLPTTELDDSARNSVSLVSRYIGILIAVLWGLAALGIGLERIALLLSALSVGIGFGLQAITQNFVSGLILLAERPVKIGDLVRIGNDEGDVRRISVRSTEIELGDHSTLIVPNSKLITESVLNKTLVGLGRVQIQFTVPLGTDPGPVRDVVLGAFADSAAILDAPAPVVFIDGIADGRIAFNCFAHVSGPRDAYPARSGVLMQILQRFAADGIDIGTANTRLELIGGTGIVPGADAAAGSRAS